MGNIDKTSKLSLLFSQNFVLECSKLFSCMGFIFLFAFMSLIVKDHDAVSSAKTTIISYLMVLIWELIFFGQIVQLVRAYKDLMNNGAKEFKFTLDTVYMFIIFLVGSFIALHCINGFFNGNVVEKYVVFYWLMVLAFILGSVVGLIGFTKLFLKSIKVL